jgi:hypothetical protein
MRRRWNGRFSSVPPQAGQGRRGKRREIPGRSSLNDPYGNANCLILHDWNDELDQAKWLHIALQFFFEAGAEPNCAHVGKEGGGFATLKLKTIEKRLAQGTRFKSISLSCTRPPHIDVERWTVSANFNLMNGSKRTMAFIHDSRNADIDLGLFTDLVHRLCELVRPAYGYGLQRAFSKGPGWYAFDLSYGLDARLPEDKADEGRIVLWHRERLDMIVQNKPAARRHLQGMQRDVFPFNILSATHLSREIEGVAFEDWVRADPARGRLGAIAEGVWTWTVSEERLLGLCASLQAAGLLITRPP